MRLALDTLFFHNRVTLRFRAIDTIIFAIERLLTLDIIMSLSSDFRYYIDIIIIERRPLAELFQPPCHDAFSPLDIFLRFSPLPDDMMIGLMAYMPGASLRRAIFFHIIITHRHWDAAMTERRRACWRLLPAITLPRLFYLRHAGIRHYAIRAFS